MTSFRSLASIVAATTILAATLACTITTGGDAGGDSGSTCSPGSSRSCNCSDAQTGTQTCNSAGSAFGACTCSGEGGTCSVAVPGACTSSDQCCLDDGSPTVCASLLGAGRICTRRCATNADCPATGCCATIADGSRACTVTRWCAGVGACTSAVGQACNFDSDCCPDTSNGVQSACTSGTASGPTCSTLCVDNGGCASSCCRAREDGLKVCRPTIECQ